MATASSQAARPRLWVAGDLNGFFGLFTNLLLNVIVLTGLSLTLVKLDDELVSLLAAPAEIAIRTF